jgi:SSS family solute:Na+ symporter
MIFLVFLVGYVVLLLAASFVFSRRMRSLEDFFLASRSLPAFLVFFSLAASWLGATSTLVSLDEAYARGVSSFWVMGVPSVLTVLIFVIFLVRPIRQLPIVTLPDLFEMRYGRAVRHMTSILIVWYMVLLAASQMVAIGNFLKSLLGTSYFAGLLLGTSVVLIYSVAGGFVSVVVTDGFQFFLLVVGITGLLFFLLGDSSLNQVSVSAVQLGKVGYFDFLDDVEKNIWIAVSFTLAWIISPIVWQRIHASRSERAARWGLASSGIAFGLFFGAIVLIGILCLPLINSLPQDGTLLSSLVATKTSVVLGGILFVGIVAAIMSTMDTAINTGAMSLTRDVFQQICPPDSLTDVVRASRLATVCVGVLAFLIATRVQGILKTLGLASEIMTEGLFVPGIAMIFLRRQFPRAGFLSLCLGGGYSVIGFLNQTGLVQWGWPEWPYSVPYGLALSFSGFLMGILIDVCIRKKT